ILGFPAEVRRNSPNGASQELGRLGPSRLEFRFWRRPSLVWRRAGFRARKEELQWTEALEEGTAEKGHGRPGVKTWSSGSPCAGPYWKGRLGVGVGVEEHGFKGDSETLGPGMSFFTSSDMLPADTLAVWLEIFAVLGQDQYQIPNSAVLVVANGVAVCQQKVEFQ
ncbi:hypothetical protein MKZ38_004547, partial [Zalerion maritima]